jgi:hypothetical protein
MNLTPNLDNEILLNFNSSAFKLDFYSEFTDYFIDNNLF